MVNKLFASIEQKKSHWINIINSKVKDYDVSNDIYQNCNLKILELIHSGKVDVEAISYNDQINYGYYYRVLYNGVLDYLKAEAKFKKSHRRIELMQGDIQYFEDAKRIQDDQLNSLICSDEEIEIVFLNKCEKITLHDLANERSTNYSDVWRKKQEGLSKLKKHYEKIKEAELGMF